MSEHHGKVWWNELNTRDVKGAIEYYSKILGWEFAEVPMPVGTYWLANLNGETVAGIMDMDLLDGMEGIPNHWFTYFAVADVDATVAQTVAAGGTEKVPPFDVPDVGRIGIVMDPAGVPLGFMTPPAGQ